MHNYVRLSCEREQGKAEMSEQNPCSGRKVPGKEDPKIEMGVVFGGRRDFLCSVCFSAFLIFRNEYVCLFSLFIMPVMFAFRRKIR